MPPLSVYVRKCVGLHLVLGVLARAARCSHDRADPLDFHWWLSGYQCRFLATDAPWYRSSWLFKLRLYVRTYMRTHASARVYAVCFFRDKK